MNTHADKTQENKSQSVANAFSQKEGSCESSFQFVDNRPEAVTQRKLQEMANNRLQVRPDTKQAIQLQALANYNADQNQQPIQKKEMYTRLSNNLKLGMDSVVQGYFEIESSDTKSFVKEQERKQNRGSMKNAKESTGGLEPFTTVGFEHEFAQTEGSDLAGVSHLELAESSNKMPYTDLPFILETDADNALELVSPPFLVRTLKDQPIPVPEDLEDINQMLRNTLGTITQADATIGDIVNLFPIGAGINFSLRDVQVEPKNLSYRTEKGYHKTKKNLKIKNLKDIKVVPTRKGGGITSQINFASDAHTFDKLQEIPRYFESSSLDPIRLMFSKLETDILDAVVSIVPKEKRNKNVDVFLNLLARNLAGQFAIPSMEFIKKIQKDLFDNELDHSDVQSREKSIRKQFILNANIASKVKDINGTWVKDSLMNIGIGILDSSDWFTIMELLKNVIFITQLRSLSFPDYKAIKGFEGFDTEGNNEIKKILESGKGLMLTAISTLHSQIAKHATSEEEIGLFESLENKIITGRMEKYGVDASITEDDERSYLTEDEYLLWVRLKDKMNKQNKKGDGKMEHTQDKQADFMSHDPDKVGPRQDTYIDTRKAQIPDVWTDRRLHVVEVRGNAVESLYHLVGDFSSKSYDDQTDSNVERYQILKRVINKLKKGEELETTEIAVKEALEHKTRNAIVGACLKDGISQSALTELLSNWIHHLYLIFTEEEIKYFG